MTTFSRRDVFFITLFGMLISFAFGVFFGQLAQIQETEFLRFQHFSESQDVIEGLNFANVTVGNHTHTVDLVNPYGTPIQVHVFFYTEPLELKQHGYLHVYFYDNPLDQTMNGSRIEAFKTQRVRFTLEVRKHVVEGEWYIRFVSVVL